MRIVVQRVSRAAVDVEGERVGEIGPGLLALVGIGRSENEEAHQAMARKLVNLRLFPDPDDPSHFSRSLLETGGDLLLVSQFTLYANCRKGRRPSFSEAGAPEEARRLFDRFVRSFEQYPIRVETGVFGALMRVSLHNEGPVTLWLDSEELIRKGTSRKG